MHIDSARPASPYLARTRRSLQEACMALRRAGVASDSRCDVCKLLTLCNPKSSPADPASSLLSQACGCSDA